MTHPSPGPSTPPPPPAPPRGEALLPVSEVAALWRCSVDHIYDLIAAGELRSIQLTRGRAKTRIPESALAEFIAAQYRPRRHLRAVG
jgi:excisionase family DNA binding protein